MKKIIKETTMFLCGCSYCSYIEDFENIGIESNSKNGSTNRFALLRCPKCGEINRKKLNRKG